MNRRGMREMSTVDEFQTIWNYLVPAYSGDSVVHFPGAQPEPLSVFCWHP